MNAREILQSWQRARLPLLRKMTPPPLRIPDVTIGAYHFWDPQQADAQFASLECSIRETWRLFGFLPVVVVTIPEPCAALLRFSETYAQWVEIQTSTRLHPGSVPSMSQACNAEMARIFSTQSLLIVQNDGFPIRSGLEAYLSWDYVGAPFLRPTRMNRLLGLWPKFSNGNGGFSLRTKKICERANRLWPLFSPLPAACRMAREDVYYSLLVRLFGGGNLHYAPLEACRTFAWDALYPDPPNECPLGIHGAEAFVFARQKGWVEDL